MTSEVHKIKTLLWKHVRTSKRCYVKTCAELVSMLVFFLFLFLIKDKLAIRRENRETHDSVPMAQDDLVKFTHISNIYYSPNDSHFINGLMNDIAVKLDLQEEEVKSYLNEHDLLEKNENIIQKCKSCMAIIFNNENLNNVTSLNYTIRSSGSYESDKTEPAVLVPGPHEQYGGIYERFALLQILIDTRFIEIQSGIPVTKKISIQAFPYPSYTKDDNWSMKYHVFLPFFTANSYLPFIIFVIGRLMTEKSCGIKELMKMIGVNKPSFWISNYIRCAFPQVVIIVIVTILLHIGGPNSLLPKTSPFLTFLILFLYLNYVTLMAFFFSMLFSEPLIASLFGCISWVFSQIFHSIYGSSIKSFFMIFLWSLMPNTHIYWIFEIIGYFEMRDMEITYSNLTMPIRNDSSLNLLLVILLLCWNSLLLNFAVYYLENINPGPYGLKKSPLFIFKMSYWESKIAKVIDYSLYTNDSMDYYEETDSSNRVAINISGVSKVFKVSKNYHKKALNNIHLNIYENCITSLLGQNGSGKTTLISIISGMIPATKGNVYIKGKNIKDVVNQNHRGIGLCPQDNMTFPDLSVKEHILFVAMMQGLNETEAANECNVILNQLNLEEKANEMCFNLSGGTQRRLQLAIALAGKSSILILDEPTSGLDPKHRREIWNILLNLKKDHTILLTTHFLDEADVLGDHIAIMCDSKVKAYGSSMYLKNKICPGYKLQVFKDVDFKMKPLEDELKESGIIYQMVHDEKKEMHINLKSSDHNKIENLISRIESDLHDLKINQISLSIPLLEEVFLKLCDCNCDYSEEDIKNLDSAGLNSRKSTQIIKYEKNISMNYILLSLLWKQFLYIKKKVLLWLPQIVMLVILIAIASTMKDDEYVVSNRNINIDLSLYNKPNVRVFYDGSDLERIKLNKSNNIRFIKAEPNVYDAILESGHSDIANYIDSVIVAVRSDEYENTVFYSTSVYHALPVAVNLMTNIMASQVLGDSPGPYVVTHNHPIKSEDMKFEYETSRPTHLLLLWAFMIGFAWNMFMSIFLSYPSNENATGSKQLQYTTGMEKYLYWSSLTIFDLVFCLSVSPLMFLILFDPYKVFTLEILLSVIFPLLLLYFLSTLSMVYLISLFLSLSSSFTFFFLLNVFSCFLALMYCTQKLIGMSHGFVDFTMFFFGNHPNVQLLVGLFNIAQVSQERNQCYVREGYFGNNNVTSFCCDRDEKTGVCYGLKSFYHDADFGIADVLIKMLCCLMLLWTIIWIAENNKVKAFIKRRLCKDAVEKSDNPLKDIKIQDSSVDEVDGSQKSITVKEVGLDYFRFRGRSISAVKSFSLDMKKGECFGLIGLNGAGKTSAFKVITGSVPPTRGQIHIFENTLENNRKKYLQSIGYCPQYDSVSDYLTAQEALKFYSVLRGFPKNKIDEEVDELIDTVGIKELRDVPIMYYSGGNKRKLSLAVSLTGLKINNAVILLDEPTTGVDPQSRTVLHMTIRKALQRECSVILSSHNISECESLCNRIGIMVDGELKDMGNAQKVKEKNGFGFSITIKLSNDYKGGEDVKNHIENKFKWKLRDSYQSLLQYFIEGKHKYSDLFSKMQEVKSLYKNRIVMYSISEPSLEEAVLTYLNN